MSKILYHYTSFEAFINIIEKEQLWASKIQYMSDSREFMHGLNLINKIYGKEESFFKYMKNADTFALSLSEKKDDLDQWRGYTANGHGLCIGFSEKILTEQLNEETFFLNKCL